MRNFVHPSHLTPDARGGGFLCFRASDAGIPSEGAVQAQHGRAGPVHLPVWISSPGKEETGFCQQGTCSVKLVHRGAATHSVVSLHFWVMAFWVKCSTLGFYNDACLSHPGATSRAERPFPVPEFPHINVCLILVSHSFPHLPPSACGHSDFWHFHVWGRKSFESIFWLSILHLLISLLL